MKRSMTIRLILPSCKNTRQIPQIASDLSEPFYDYQRWLWDHAAVLIFFSFFSFLSSLLSTIQPRQFLLLQLHGIANSAGQA